MKIEIWSDIGCPYCYIAAKRLENALNRFEYKDTVEIITKSFELEPDIAIDGKESQHTAVMRKYKQSAPDAHNTLKQAEDAAKENGINIHWDKVITTNSFDAHRLVHYASSIGKGHEMEMKLFHAYFSEGMHIGDRKTLISLAAELGLDAKVAIEGNHFSQDVKKDEYDARSLGIRSVPYMLFDEKFAVTGARSEDEFLSMLYQFREEAIKRGIIELPNTPGCEGGSCTI